MNGKIKRKTIIRTTLTGIIHLAALVCFSKNAAGKEFDEKSNTSPSTYYSRLKNDTLVIGNRLIERKFIWNKGNVITYSLTDQSSGQIWVNKTKTPDFYIGKNQEPVSNTSYNSREIKENAIHPPYLETEVSFSLGTLYIKKIYRIYSDSPVIACDIYLKGSTDVILEGTAANPADMKNIEFAEDMKSKQVTAILDQIKLDGFHWQTKIVEFFDVTDWNNNLVSERKIIPYRKNTYRGNLLFAHNNENDKGLFFLKEAPSSSTQLAYNGYDFTTEFGHFMVSGLGMTQKDISPNEWRKAYGVVMGVYSGSELNQLTALRSYQKNIRKLLPERDEMVMMNTWGDRSQDSKVNEKFSLIEVNRAAELGISHFQIDDGWQSGKSPNSAVAKGSFKNIWDNPDYWKPDSEKYPRGLHPVVKKGKELGVEICLWFNPSVQNDYADWKKDAEAIVGLYKQYGIRTFKIDGLAIPTRQSEINLRKLFDTVLEKTDNQVVFNLDATAGRRGGYHTFNEYGNIFLENRYTDWQNYYPYWTLRNLWQLSKYVPAEKLQIEFLNKWRNTAKYGSDIFAPQHYSFEYLFATTMAGQPLAWFEGSGLPKEGLSIGQLIKAYKKVQHDFHTGVILPIGEEPSGKSWTGFQSVKDGTGYFIFYRENTPDSVGFVNTWLTEGTQIKCTPVLGNGKAMIATTSRNGIIEVKLPDVNDFVMYRYEIIHQ
ncbi:alpha-galactosidase [Pararcticibacter amylolyticus]|uniref:Alpha-galactosidase n=1 Tax=Pararcticibacter amylolyticus TaxID=2173175 RepID=A0A2U2PHQ0_9SPHI|nr:alpha-galactosidase [Pararcticibacter amylolyticus]PWG80937.1 alpha-galactosidase [Pararcticibacter amylolyticus]